MCFKKKEFKMRNGIICNKIHTSSKGLKLFTQGPVQQLNWLTRPLEALGSHRALSLT